MSYVLELDLITLNQVKYISHQALAALIAFVLLITWLFFFTCGSKRSALLLFLKNF